MVGSSSDGNESKFLESNHIELNQDFNWIIIKSNQISKISLSNRID